MLVIGNGESRIDLDIDSYKLPTVGCNAIFRDRKVDHLVCCDKRMVREAINHSNTQQSCVYTRHDWNEDFGVFPENTNFGVKSSVVENLIQAHNVKNPSPNTKEMNKSDLGYNIKQATLYLSCWMTLAQIKKFSTKKVIFRDLVN